MNARCCLFFATIAATLPASAIRIMDGWHGSSAFMGIGAGFDNTIQTDAFGSEDGTSVRATAMASTIGNDITYDIDFCASVGLSKNLTAGLDITNGVSVELLIQIFDASYQKLGRVDITGANLTKFELDESGVTHGYPSLRFTAEPTVPALSANHQLPFTARFGISLRFDAAFDGLDNDLQTVIVTDAPRDDLGPAMHPSTPFGIGVSASFAGVEGVQANFRYFVRSGLVDSYGGGYTFDDVQGSVSGYTYPSGFQFTPRGDPAALGVTYDLGMGGETYRAFDLSYDGWDGTDDLQIGVNFAPRDQDNDGLPDDWEDANGFDKTVPNPPGADTDGDGQSDWDEFLQGTDPRDRLSMFHIISVDYALPDPDLMLRWTSRTDRDYELQHLDAGALKWDPIPGVGLLPGQAGTTSYTLEDADTVLGDSAQIRVMVVRQF